MGRDLENISSCSSRGGFCLAVPDFWLSSRGSPGTSRAREHILHRNRQRPKSSAAPSTHTPSSTHSSSSSSISHASTSGCPIQFFTRRSARAVLSTKRFRFFVINNEACRLVSFLPPRVQYGPPLIARLRESCGITAILRFLLSYKVQELFQEYGIVGQL
jgi:hypothetical protein